MTDIELKAKAEKRFLREDSAPLYRHDDIRFFKYGNNRYICIQATYPNRRSLAVYKIKGERLYKKNSEMAEDIFSFFE